MAAGVHWSDLQYFLAVCERGSIGAAAQQLRVNHSTVLRRLASLERALDVRLFDRQPGGYLPTPQGQALAASLSGITEQVDAAQRRIGGGDLALRGTIRLTAPDTLVGLLVPHLATFRAAHPQLALELVINNSFLSLSRREADVALRGSNRPPEQLIGRRVGRLQTALYASSAYLERQGAGDPEADYDWVGADAALAHLDSARWLRRHVPDERVVLRVDNLIAAADAVAAGIGVGWLLCHLADARHGLQLLRPPKPEFDTQLWVLTHPDLKRVARIRALTDFLYAALGADSRLQHA
jgi:DNA-binding transcriptional LysR family regulator